MQVLTLVRGIPGSGKTTVAKALADTLGAEHHEGDHYFEREDGTYYFDPNQLPKAHAQCQHRVRMALIAGKSVVVSNTFTQRWEIQPYLHMATDHGATVQVITVQAGFESVHNVPKSALDRMRNRMEFWDDLT